MHHEGPRNSVVSVLPMGRFRSNFGASTGVSGGTQRHIKDLQVPSGTPTGLLTLVTHHIDLHDIELIEKTQKIHPRILMTSRTVRTEVAPPRPPTPRPTGELTPVSEHRSASNSVEGRPRKRVSNETEVTSPNPEVLAGTNRRGRAGLGAPNPVEIGRKMAEIRRLEVSVNDVIKPEVVIRAHA